jgi:hypothetical protein
VTRSRRRTLTREGEAIFRRFVCGQATEAECAIVINAIAEEFMSCDYDAARAIALEFHAERDRVFGLN